MWTTFEKVSLWRPSKGSIVTNRLCGLFRRLLADICEAHGGHTSAEACKARHCWLPTL